MHPKRRGARAQQTFTIQLFRIKANALTRCCLKSWSSSRNCDGHAGLDVRCCLRIPNRAETATMLTYRIPMTQMGQRASGRGCLPEGAKAEAAATSAKATIWRSMLTEVIYARSPFSRPVTREKRVISDQRDKNVGRGVGFCTFPNLFVRHTSCAAAVRPVRTLEMMQINRSCSLEATFVLNLGETFLSF